jgi:hypothetical protein
MSCSDKRNLLDSPKVRPWEAEISDGACRRLLADDVSALSEARFQEELRTSTMVRRAFDKAVRRKPPVVAADAGPMGIQLREGEVSRCAEAVRQSTTDDSGG